MTSRSRRRRSPPSTSGGSTGRPIHSVRGVKAVEPRVDATTPTSAGEDDLQEDRDRDHAHRDDERANEIDTGAPRLPREQGLHRVVRPVGAARARPRTAHPAGSRRLRTAADRVEVTQQEPVIEEGPELWRRTLCVVVGSADRDPGAATCCSALRTCRWKRDCAWSTWPDGGSDIDHGDPEADDDDEQTPTTTIGTSRRERARRNSDRSSRISRLPLDPSSARGTRSRGRRRRAAARSRRDRPRRGCG